MQRPEGIPRRKIKTLQVGRAIAALSVVFGHMDVLISMKKYGGYKLFDFWPMVGSYGVDFFFVLSGFIIYFAHERDIGVPSKARTYIWRRFCRVYPIYWFYTIGFSVLVIAGVGDRELSLQPLDILSYLTLVHFTAAIAPLGVAWTLFYEITFYALFVVLIFNRSVGKLVFLLWFVIIALNFQHPYADKGSFLGDFTSWMNINFFAGIAVYKLYAAGFRRFPIIAGVVGLGLIIAGAVLWKDGYIYMFPWLRPIFAAGFALVLYSAITAETIYSFRVPSSLVLLGDASYTMYLAHLPLISLVLIIVTKAAIMPTVDPIVIYFVGATTIVGVTVVAYWVIERNLLSALRKINFQGSKLRRAQEETAIDRDTGRSGVVHR